MLTHLNMQCVTVFGLDAHGQVQHDNAAMVKDLGTLSAAEAEASAQRRSLKAQVGLFL